MSNRFIYILGDLKIKEYLKIEKDLKVEKDLKIERNLKIEKDLKLEASTSSITAIDGNYECEMITSVIESSEGKIFMTLLLNHTVLDDL